MQHIHTSATSANITATSAVARPELENGLRTSADPSDMQHIQVHRAPVPTVGTTFAMARAVFEAGT